MTASVRDLQIASRNLRDRIYAVIAEESAALSSDYEVCVLDSGIGNMWEIWIKQPDGRRISKQLDADAGDLTAAVLRVRFRELLKSL